MYFCPCSCNDPIDPETEENTFVALPRNLSYVQDSYLDRYSVSARFVHNPKIERCIQHEQHEEYKANVEDETLGLLSVIKAQDLSANNCEALRPLLSPTSPAYTRPESPTFHSAFSIYASSYVNSTGANSSSTTSPPLLSSSSLLAPASRLASKLSSLIHSPPNECIDRDAGSSVDGDNISLVMDALGGSGLSSLGEDMDRGANPKFDNETEHYSTHCDNGDLDPDLVLADMLSNELDDTGLVEPGEGLAGGTSAVDDLELKPYGVRGKTHFPKIDTEEMAHKTGLHVSVDPGNGPVPFGSPDSDGFSEEGIFVNMDDLENTEKSTTVSEVGDDTYVSVDSMFSPEEGDVDLESVLEPSRMMTLQEAIDRAASDLSKITLNMYGESSKQDQDAEFHPELSDESLKARITLASMGRASPVRMITGLKLQVIEQSSVDGQAPGTESPTDQNESPVYSESEFNFSRIQLRKSSSLKTNKTPPGTPHRKKVVRFADAMGLDLESVRHVLNMESPPKIPASAMADLRAGLSEDRKVMGSKYLCPCFNQPGAAENFIQKVLAQKVCLENAIITDLTITGIVRVSNISFHKSVRVRYTHNSWATFHDIAASYVQNSCDGPTDRFSFSIVAPPYFGPGSQLEFAVSYNAGGVEYWDGNDGKNYVFECFAKTVPTENESAWIHFL